MTIYRHCKIAAALALALVSAGCGYVQDQAPGTVSPKRGAKLLPAPDASAQPARQVASYYSQSFSECMTFKEGLLSASSGVNAGSDYTALLLNALASVVAPVATVHLLTAGAAAVGGIKSTYAKDIAADNTVNLTIAFDKIYFQPMARLAQTRLAAPITSDSAPGILAQILSLQSQCSLDEARAYINQNLSQSASR